MSAENNNELNPEQQEEQTLGDIMVEEVPESKSEEISKPKCLYQSYSYSREVFDGKIVEKEKSIKRVDDDWYIRDENNDWKPSSKEEALSAPVRESLIDNMKLGSVAKECTCCEDCKESKRNKKRRDDDFVKSLSIVAQMVAPAPPSRRFFGWF